jgi:hypothetical protein
MNHREKVFTFGGTSWFRAKLCLGGVNPPRQPSPPEPTEQTFGSHLTLPLMTLQSFPTGMWSSVASASSAATRRTCTHGHQRRIPTCARTFFAPLRTRVRTLQDWCRRNPLLTIDTSVSAFASDRYPMPAHNPIDREASRKWQQKKPLVKPRWKTYRLSAIDTPIGVGISLTTLTLLGFHVQRGQLYTKKRPDARGRAKSLSQGEQPQ